jgi:hypothetical protein
MRGGRPDAVASTAGRAVYDFDHANRGVDGRMRYETALEATPKKLFL